MPREPIPEELRRFILTSVPTVPFLEALLLFREARGAAVGTDVVARRLYLSDAAAAQVIAQLADARIVRQADVPGSHRFAPDSPQLAAMLDMLAEFYRTHLVDVTDIIHARTGRKARQFADAFKLRKDS